MTKEHKLMKTMNTNILAAAALCAVLLTGYSCTNTLKNPDAVVEPIEIFFNQPGANRHTVLVPEVEGRIIRLFDNAQQSIYFSFYGFSHEGIADAAVRAVERGLIVQFAGDHSHYSRGEVGYRKFEEAARVYSNAEMSVGNSQSIMHNKWAVIDEKLVFTGTGNITYTGMRTNDNVWLIIRSEKLAKDFKKEHQQMMRGRFGVAKKRVDTDTEFCVGVGDVDVDDCRGSGGVIVENWFSPQEYAMGEFITGVKRATHDVNYMIFAFTHDKLGRELNAKHKAFYAQNRDGGDRYVRGALDRSQFSHAQYVEVYRLAGNCGHDVTPANPECMEPMEMRRDGNENTTTPGDWQGGGGRLHSKAMIIDAEGGQADPQSLVGSFNWSINASTNNDENLVVIHDQRIASRMLAKFNELYANSPILPGDKKKYQDVIISEVNWAGSVRVICFDGPGPNARKITYTENCPNRKYYPYDGNEFVELHNPGNQPVDISYWSLFFPNQEASRADSGSKKKRAVIGFPEGTSIPPNGYFVVWEPDQRNDRQDGFKFETRENLLVYSPYNGLSNFMSLYDRRNGDTLFRRNEITGFAGCEPAFSYFTTRFSGSNEWRVNTGTDRFDGGFNQFGFRIELKDSKGNLIDVAGPSGILSTPPQRGGFSPTSPPALDAASPTLPDYECGLLDSEYTFSMERIRNADGTWLPGDAWSGWQNAQSVGVFIRKDFKERTLGSPGEANSIW